MDRPDADPVDAVGDLIRFYHWLTSRLSRRMLGYQGFFALQLFQWVCSLAGRRFAGLKSVPVK